VYNCRRCLGDSRNGRVDLGQGVGLVSHRIGSSGASHARLFRRRGQWFGAKEHGAARMQAASRIGCPVHHAEIVCVLTLKGPGGRERGVITSGRVHGGKTRRTEQTGEASVFTTRARHGFGGLFRRHPDPRRNGGGGPREYVNCVAVPREL
jgi:hypothetical protein